MIKLKKQGQRLMAKPQQTRVETPVVGVVLVTWKKSHWFDPQIKLKHLAGFDIGR